MSEQSLARAVLAWMEVPLDQDGGTFPELEAMARASLSTPPADDVREALTSVEELEALPTRSVVMDGSGEVWRKTVTGLWDCLDGQGDQPVEESSTVLWQSAPPRVAVLCPAGEVRPRGTVTPPADDVREALADEPVCAWCPNTARGSAWHNDGRLHPSCGQIGHGQGWVPPDHEVRPHGTVTDAEVEAACRAFYEDASGMTQWNRLVAVEPEIADRYRVGMHAALKASREVRS